MVHNMISFGLPGNWEWIVILAIAVLIFGSRIPKIARSIGQSLSEFRKGIKEVDDTKTEIEKEIRDSIQ